MTILLFKASNPFFFLVEEKNLLLENRHAIETQRKRSRVIEQDACAISLHSTGKPPSDLVYGFVRGFSRQISHNKI
jgi:hypothetical protein